MGIIRLRCSHMDCCVEWYGHSPQGCSGRQPAMPCRLYAFPTIILYHAPGKIKRNWARYPAKPLAVRGSSTPAAGFACGFFAFRKSVCGEGRSLQRETLLGPGGRRWRWSDLKFVQCTLCGGRAAGRPVQISHVPSAEGRRTPKARDRLRSRAFGVLLGPRAKRG